MFEKLEIEANEIDQSSPDSSHAVGGVILNINEYRGEAPLRSFEICAQKFYLLYIMLRFVILSDLEHDT